MSEHITTLKRPYGWIYSHATTEKAKHAFLRKGGVPLKGRLLNECTISSLPELGCNLWNVSQGRGLERVSNRKFWAVYAYITFLSHPERESSTNTTFLCWNKMGGVGVGRGQGADRAEFKSRCGC